MTITDAYFLGIIIGILIVPTVITFLYLSGILEINFNRVEEIENEESI